MNKEIEHFIETADYHDLIDFMAKANRRVFSILDINMDEWSAYILNSLGKEYEDYLTCVPEPVKVDHQYNYKFNCNNYFDSQ